MVYRVTLFHPLQLCPPPDVDMGGPGWCGGPALVLPRVQLDGVVLALVPAVMYYLETPHYLAAAHVRRT